MLAHRASNCDGVHLLTTGVRARNFEKHGMHLCFGAISNGMDVHSEMALHAVTVLPLHPIV